MREREKKAKENIENGFRSRNQTTRQLFVNAQQCHIGSKLNAGFGARVRNVKIRNELKRLSSAPKPFQERHSNAYLRLPFVCMWMWVQIKPWIHFSHFRFTLFTFFCTLCSFLSYWISIFFFFGCVLLADAMFFIVLSHTFARTSNCRYRLRLPKWKQRAYRKNDTKNRFGSYSMAMEPVITETKRTKWKKRKTKMKPKSMGKFVASEKTKKFIGALAHSAAIHRVFVRSLRKSSIIENKL